MVELKNNKTAEELIRRIKSVIEEKCKKNQASIDDYIKCGEEKLKETHIAAVKSLGDFSKLIFGCIYYEVYTFNYYEVYTFNRVEQMSIFDNTPPIGDNVFDKVDWSRLSGISINLLEYLGTPSRYSFNEEIQQVFGQKLGRQLMGLMMYYHYLSFLDSFESKANEDKNSAPLRSLHRFFRTEKIDDVPFPYCNDERSMYKYNSDMANGCSEITIEESEFVCITMDILKGKALEFYDRIKGQNLSDYEIEKNVVSEVFNFLSIPYIGFFDSLDSALGNIEFNSEYWDNYEEPSPQKNDQQRFVKKIYRMFINYIREQKRIQLAKERKMINSAGKYIREAFDSCETIEEKMALARAYALDKKSNMIANGLELLRILRINPRHKMSDDERILYHYIMSMYYARPTLCHVKEENGEYYVNLDYDPRFNMRYLMAKAGEQRKKFERLYVKKTLSSCETIEQKLALAREYAIGGKCLAITDGKELLSALNIRPCKEEASEDNILYYYAMSIFGIRSIYWDTRNADLDFAYYHRIHIRDQIDETKGHIKKFLKLCNSMGVSAIPNGDIAKVQDDIDCLIDGYVWVTSVSQIIEDLCGHMGAFNQDSDELVVIRADSDDLVDEIAAAMSVLNEGNVIGIHEEPKSVTYMEVESMDGIILGYSSL